MFDSLGNRLDGILGRLRGRGRISDADLDEAFREIRTALLEADVDVSVARSLIEGIRARTSGAALSQSLTPGQQVVKAVNEELARRSVGKRSKFGSPLSRRQSSCSPDYRVRARPPRRRSSPAGSASKAAIPCSSAPTFRGLLRSSN